MLVCKQCLAAHEIIVVVDRNLVDKTLLSKHSAVIHKSFYRSMLVWDSS